MISSINDWIYLSKYQIDLLVKKEKQLDNTNFLYILNWIYQKHRFEYYNSSIHFSVLLDIRDIDLV